MGKDIGVLVICVFVYLIGIMGNLGMFVFYNISKGLFVVLVCWLC